ncbi:MAG: hypothetical protein JWP89_3567 [Schlesneria sp.]|nr:hypothetical protein [Schlesneria sp.]
MNHLLSAGRHCVTLGRRGVVPLLGRSGTSCVLCAFDIVEVSATIRVAIIMRLELNDEPTNPLILQATTQFPTAPRRMRLTQLDHPRLHHRSRLRGTMMGTTRLILQTSSTRLLVATQPLVAGLPRHTESSADLCDVRTLDTTQLDKLTTNDYVCFHLPGHRMASAFEMPNDSPTVSPMSPNTCYLCLQSIQGLRSDR